MALVAAKVALLTLGLNYGVHYTSARIYDTLCIPHSLGDMFQSLATTASPACSFVLNTMVFTQNNYANVFTTTITSLVTSAIKSA